MICASIPLRDRSNDIDRQTALIASAARLTQANNILEYVLGLHFKIACANKYL